MLLRYLHTQTLIYHNISSNKKNIFKYDLNIMYYKNDTIQCIQLQYIMQKLTIFDKTILHK